MKKLFVAIIIIIAVGLIAPKFIGGIVGEKYQSGFDKINENPAININSNTFVQNWFSGKSITEITLLIESEGIDNLTLIIEEDLSFGPVIFSNEGIKFALSYSEANINIKELPIDEEISSFIKDKIHLSTLITYSMDFVSNIAIDEISKEVDGNKVVSAKAVGHFTLEDNKRVYGDFNWAGLTAKTSDEDFTISGVNFTLDQTLIAGDYYQGDALSTGNFDFTVAAINAKDTQGNAVFTLEKLLMGAESTVTNDLMKIQMNYSAEQIVTAGQQLKNANLAIVLNGLNIKVLQELNTLMTEISTDGEEMFNAVNMERISTLATKLLADEPVVEIEDFSVQTPEGKIESAMQVSVDKDIFDAANIMSIMAAVKANATGKAPMPFFVKLGVEPMVEMYIEQGFIIKKEQELSFKVNFSQGKLTVNDQIIPM